MALVPCQVFFFTLFFSNFAISKPSMIATGFLPAPLNACRPLNPNTGIKTQGNAIYNQGGH